MPKMGESVMEGTILNWLKKEGDMINQDESVLEVATDKVDTDVPSTHAGILKQILVQVGEVVQVGKPVAIINTGGDESPAAPAAPKQEAAPAAQTASAPVVAANGHQEAAPAISGRFYSPLVLNIAKEEGISMSELERIPGTGKDARVSKTDILAYVANRGAVPAQTAAPVVAAAPIVAAPVAAAPAAQPSVAKESAPVSFSGAADIIEMDRMRKMIAERMVDSKRISPHVTSFVEADVTEMVKWRGIFNKEFKAKEGGSLTFTPIFVEAVVKALKDYPMMNSSVEGTRIIVKKDINIGMAVALPSGNLIVPVIKNADMYNLVGLARIINDIVNRAKNNKLSPDDLQGGTYTVSNVGSFGSIMGTPIIMQPQVGILALGAIVKKPAVIETPEGDFIGIRQKMFLSHSYDHRIVDGALGGMFAKRVADYLENFDKNRKLY